MPLFASNSTRIDTAFAVSQVAWFVHSPKESHTTALKVIIGCLLRTANEGPIVTPDQSFNPFAHVDAVFSGLHRQEHQDDPDSARLRHGFAISFCAVPLVWKSQLIPETCSSTTQVECGEVSSISGSDASSKGTDCESNEVSWSSIGQAPSCLQSH